MKKLILIFIASTLLCACSHRESEEELKARATELCRYVPDHQLLKASKDYLTAEFYAVLDTMFNMPDEEPLAHEWLYYFVTGNGGTIADFTVEKVEQTDDTHAIATITVRQKWEDGSFDESTDIETHHMTMEKVNGKWLMADFDDHKKDCIRHIEGHRKEKREKEMSER